MFVFNSACRRLTTPFSANQLFKILTKNNATFKTDSIFKRCYKNKGNVSPSLLPGLLLPTHPHPRAYLLFNSFQITPNDASRFTVSASLSKLSLSLSLKTFSARLRWLPLFDSIPNLKGSFLQCL